MVREAVLEGRLIELGPSRMKSGLFQAEGSPVQRPSGRAMPGASGGPRVQQVGIERQLCHALFLAQRAQ